MWNGEILLKNFTCVLNCTAQTLRGILDDDWGFRSCSHNETSPK